MTFGSLQLKYYRNLSEFFTFQDRTRKIYSSMCHPLDLQIIIFSVHSAFREATTRCWSALVKVFRDTGWERETEITTLYIYKDTYLVKQTIQHPCYSLVYHWYSCFLGQLLYWSCSPGELLYWSCSLELNSSSQP